MTLTEMGRRAKDVSRVLNTLGSREKNMGLEEAARALLDSEEEILTGNRDCLLYTSPSPRDYAASRMPSSA